MKVTKTQALVFGGLATAVIFLGAFTINRRKKKRDRAAVSFFGELERKISPESAGIEQSDAFDMNYFRKIYGENNGNIHLLTQKEGLKYAKQIKDAVGILWDSDHVVTSVFRSLKSKVEVSQVAFWYWKENDLHLIDALQYDFKNILPEVMKIVTSLPTYTNKN